MNSQKGFTLIELLVVIAIIAILAAILFPVFAKAREKAEQTTCLSNVRQIGTALMSYVQDYDERMPLTRYIYGPNPQPGVMVEGDWQKGFTWEISLYPYMKNVEIYKCPARRAMSAVYYRPSATQFEISYAANRRVFGLHGGSGTPAQAPASLGEMQWPSETIAVIDNIGHPMGYQYGATCYEYVLPYRVYQSFCSATNDYTPHNNGVNAVFLDGHAKWVSWQRVPISAECVAGSEARRFWYAK